MIFTGELLEHVSVSIVLPEPDLTYKDTLPRRGVPLLK